MYQSSRIKAKMTVKSITSIYILILINQKKIPNKVRQNNKAPLELKKKDQNRVGRKDFQITKEKLCVVLYTHLFPLYNLEINH